MSAKKSSRRRFLKNGAILTGLVAGTAGSASGQTPVPQEAANRSAGFVRATGGRSRFEISERAWSDSPTGRVAASLTPLQDSKGIITPSMLHFERHHSRVPDIDPRQHRLLIHGLVNRPLIFTVAELQRLPSVSRIYFLECSGNSRNPTRSGAVTVQRTHGMTSCSEWTGVPLSLLLQEAGLQKEASWLLAEGADAVNMTRSIPLAKATDDVLVAYGQNGGALRPEQGYPLRLLIPGWEGNISIKWLRQIKVVDRPYMTREETSRYSDLMPDGRARQFTFEMDAKSVITFPSGGQNLPGPGFCEITGLAWSGRGAIRRVELSTDGGATWQDAQLQEPLLRFAHTRFRFAWRWDGGEAVLQSRCTDEQGGYQPTVDELIRLRGNNYNYHYNHIQAWKINRDGSVQNALV